MTGRIAFVAVLAALAVTVGLGSGQPVTTAPTSAPATAPATAPADAGKWLTSYDQAAKLAADTNRLILVDFTGSDWCIWCNRLKKEVFDTPAFQKWASRKVVLLELDFPRRAPQDAATRKQNEALAEKYKVSGFPTVLFLTCDGAVQGQSGYMPGGPEVWTARADEFITEAKATTFPVCPK
jgi:protein disulfide-isomerase